MFYQDARLKSLASFFIFLLLTRGFYYVIIEFVREKLP